MKIHQHPDRRDHAPYLLSTPDNHQRVMDDVFGVTIVSVECNNYYYLICISQACISAMMTLRVCNKVPGSHAAAWDGRLKTPEPEHTTIIRTSRVRSALCYRCEMVRANYSHIVQYLELYRDGEVVYISPGPWLQGISATYHTIMKELYMWSQPMHLRACVNQLPKLKIIIIMLF